jgi:glycosyltransferase involved in cell wall biosynthesis
VPRDRARSRRRPRLLFIAFYFPPSRASGVYRSRAMANYFAEQGWDVTVVTPQREFFTETIRAADVSLEQTVHPAVRVHRVPFPTGSWESEIARYGWWRANFPVLYRRLRDPREQVWFPERYAPWIPRVVASTLRIHARHRFDLVLATGNPHSTFAAAWAFHQLTRVPYCLDYRDSWTLDVFSGEDAYPHGSRQQTWERRLLRGAERVVFVNDAIRTWYRQRYPDAADRMLVVHNGYDEDVPMPEGHAQPEDRPLLFGFLGTVSTRVPVEEFFAGWRLARKEPQLADAEVRLHGYLGFFPASFDVVKAGLPLDEGLGVTYEGPVPKMKVAETYAGLDVLLLLINSSRYVTSGKVFEYMATGKPIVSVHEPWTAASDVLRGYPLWFPARSLAPEDVRDALVAAATAAHSMTPEQVAQGRRHARQFSRRSQLEPFESQLRELTGRSGPIGQGPS